MSCSHSSDCESVRFGKYILSPISKTIHSPLTTWPGKVRQLKQISKFILPCGLYSARGCTSRPKRQIAMPSNPWRQWRCRLLCGFLTTMSCSICLLPFIPDLRRATSPLPAHTPSQDVVPKDQATYFKTSVAVGYHHRQSRKEKLLILFSLIEAE
jgi:hypothetical protein